jgi:hypothetical protein
MNRRIWLHVTLLATALTGFFIGSSTATPGTHTVTRTQNQVTSFNDGWQDAMQDDAASACSAITPKTDREACVRLFQQPATSVKLKSGAKVYNPAGPARLTECLTQYKGTELHYCLTQPQD